MVHSSLSFVLNPACVCLRITIRLSIGNVYIADYGNHRIRKMMTATGIISTFAGTGTGSYSGDNSQATDATLYNPRCIALDVSGKRVIAHKIP